MTEQHKGDVRIIPEAELRLVLSDAEHGLRNRFAGMTAPTDEFIKHSKAHGVVKTALASVPSPITEGWQLAIQACMDVCRRESVHFAKLADAETIPSHACSENAVRAFAISNVIEKLRALPTPPNTGGGR